MYQITGKERVEHTIGTHWWLKREILKNLLSIFKPVAGDVFAREVLTAPHIPNQLQNESSSPVSSNSFL